MAAVTTSKLVQPGLFFKWKKRENNKAEGISPPPPLKRNQRGTSVSHTTKMQKNENSLLKLHWDWGVSKSKSFGRNARRKLADRCCFNVFFHT